MSYLLETLGRGLLGRLRDAFPHQLPADDDAVDADTLAARVSESPTSVDLQVRFGSAALADMRLREARSAFQTAIQLEPDCRPAVIGLACVCDELGEIDQALRHLGRAAQLDPADPAIRFALGVCNEQRGDAAAARDAYNRAVELCPGLQNAHERLAALAVHSGRWSSAADHYRRLIEIAPEELDMRLTAAALELHAGDTEDAIDDFQKAMLVEPEAGTDGIEELQNIDTEPKLRHAIGSLEAMVERYPGVCEFRLQLGDLYAKAGEDAGAVAQYRAAIELHPGFLEATVKLGTQHLRNARLAEAAQAFVRAVELNDRLLTMFIGLGVSQSAAGRTAEAAATFDLAAGLAPNSTLLFSETNRLYLKTQRQRQLAAQEFDEDFDAFLPADEEDLLQEALRRHRDALLIAPMQADLHYRFAMLAQQLGDFAASTQALHTAVSITPTYAKALIKLGVSLQNEGHIAPAAEAFRRAILLRTDDLPLHYNLALLFAQQSRFDTALDQFELLTAGENDRPVLQQNISLALQNIGMIDRTRATWRAICDLCIDDTPLTASRFQSRHSDRWR